MTARGRLGQDVPDQRGQPSGPDRLGGAVQLRQCPPAPGGDAVGGVHRVDAADLRAAPGRSARGTAAPAATPTGPNVPWSTCGGVPRHRAGCHSSRSPRRARGARRPGSPRRHSARRQESSSGCRSAGRRRSASAAPGRPDRAGRRGRRGAPGDRSRLGPCLPLCRFETWAARPWCEHQRHGRDQRRLIAGAEADRRPGSAVGAGAGGPDLDHPGPAVRDGVLQAAADRARQSGGRAGRGGAAGAVVGRADGLRPLLHQGQAVRAHRRRRSGACRSRAR